ncbi:hypothetical protein SAMN04488561_1460 [Jiangella alba]|uniref:Uncharacterized protein n=2 Tax=Jiangella alba TaxID=561176 RepID=A0A1H5J6C7_9ACTN|nr:hypothetical protein SAMN04488561_1460 [Jiangella alba]
MTSSTPTSGVFDASAAAAGYAMQIRYGLYEALKRLRVGLDWQISLEAGDDIEVQDAPGYANYFQIKHRAEGTNLTDASVDLWKSLRIWCQAVADSQIDLATASFILVTTSQAPSGSIASLLSSDLESRDVPEAARRLDAVIEASDSRTNAKAYAAWLGLDVDTRRALLGRLTIAASGPDIDDVHELLIAELTLSVRRAQVDAFVARLEGWWFQRCIGIFRGTQAAFISGEELDAYLGDLREGFLPENLPVDADIPSLEPALDAFTDHRFVRQVDLVGVGKSRIASAVRDYLRAYTQRSRWTRESLIIPDEIDRYERQLIEEWRYVFDRCADSLPDGASEALKSEVAKQIYQWVEEATAPPIRDRCTERFLVRGSLHMLADRVESGVGWHPEFTARLIALLEPAEI